MKAKRTRAEMFILSLIASLFIGVFASTEMYGFMVEKGLPEFLAGIAGFCMAVAVGFTFVTAGLWFADQLSQNGG
jgi:hypothetical protein